MRRIACGPAAVNKTLPIFSVQYHPEAAPGPHDARYLFQRFLDLLEEPQPAGR